MVNEEFIRFIFIDYLKSYMNVTQLVMNSIKTSVRFRALPPLLKGKHMTTETILIEKYLKRTKSSVPGKGTIPIFVNPTVADRKGPEGLGKIIRFTLDNKKKKAYAWGYDQAHHVDVSRGVGIKHRYDDPDLLTGVATWMGGKYVFSSSDMLKDFKQMVSSEREYITALLDNDWSWANRCIEVDSTLDKLRNYLNGK